MWYAACYTKKSNELSKCEMNLNLINFDNGSKKDNYVLQTRVRQTKFRVNTRCDGNNKLPLPRKATYNTSTISISIINCRVLI